MLNYLSDNYNSLPDIIKVPAWFFINIIVIRGIIANEIMLEIRQRGWLKKGILHRTIKHVDKWYLIARKSAIFQHYKFGHAGGVGECREGRCHLI